MEAIADPFSRDKFFNEMVAKFYGTGKAINIASVLEIDQVINPVEGRDWIIQGTSIGAAAPRRPQAPVRGYLVAHRKQRVLDRPSPG